MRSNLDWYWSLALLCLGLFALFRLLPLWPLIAKPFDPVAVGSLYNQSQFAADPTQRRLIIQDWDLYPFAGYEYLRHGNIKTLNPEHPPLGKYLYGFGVLGWQRPVIIAAVMALLEVLGLSLLAYHFWGRSLWTLTVPLALVMDPQWLTNASYSLLDQLLATVLIWFCLLVVRSPRSLSTSIGAGFLLGIIASIKFPIPALIVGFIWMFVSVIWYRKHWKRPLLGIGIALTVYAATYIQFFVTNGLRGFIQIHLSAIKLHLSHVPNYPWGAPVRVMVLNQWPVWFDAIQPIWPAPDWNWRWPMVAVALMMAPVWLWTVRKQEEKRKLYAWSFLVPLAFGYFLFLNTRLFFPNYLYPVLPFGYLILIGQLGSLFRFWNRKNFKPIGA